MEGRMWCVLSGVTLVVLACGPSSAVLPTSSSGAHQPKPGGTLNVHVSPDPFNWDITFSRSTPNGDAVALAYDSLLGFKKGPEYEFNQLELQPELAERWEVSADAKTFTFHLRRGAKFQNLSPVNGREVTSADAKFSAEYRLRTGEFKDKKLPKAEMDYILQGHDRVDTPDRYTAVFHFKEPFVPFINYAASDGNPILAREIYDQEGHFQERLVGAGPYILDVGASQKGTRWIWKKNLDYWDPGKPYLDGIRWLVINEESTANAAFQTKQLDMLIERLDYHPAQEVLKAAPQATYYKFLQPNSSHIPFSQVEARNSPLRDIRLRKAVSFAIDRDEMNKAFFGGEGEWGLPGTMHGLFTPAEVRQLYRYDVEEARRLVREAGYRNGVTVELIIHTEETRTNISTMELLQAQLKKADINLELKFYDKTDQRAKRRQGAFDLDHIPAGFSSLHDDLDSLQFGRFHSGSQQNYNKVNDPELDRLLVATRRELNPEKRRELQRAVVQQVVEKAWGVDLLHAPKWRFWHPYVKNFKPNFGSQADYSMVWLER